MFTHWRDVGKSTLALVNPVPRPRHPYGGHVGDQQLSQVCSHLCIPAAPQCHGVSVRGRDEGVIFKSHSGDIPPSGSGGGGHDDENIEGWEVALVFLRNEPIFVSGFPPAPIGQILNLCKYV